MVTDVEAEAPILWSPDAKSQALSVGQIQIHQKRLWCWGKLKVGREGDHRGWDGCMASPIQWACVWVTPGDGEEQERLTYCSPWGLKESYMTERVNNKNKYVPCLNSFRKVQIKENFHILYMRPPSPWLQNQTKILEKKKRKLKANINNKGLLRWLSGKESACQCRRYRFNPWVRKISRRRKWKPNYYTCFENSMDGGAWQGAIHGNTKYCTWLSD